MTIRLSLSCRGGNLPIATMSNESEFAWYKKITKVLSTVGYYAGSYASWQKGAIGNENKLIKQIHPEGIDIEVQPSGIAY